MYDLDPSDLHVGMTLRDVVDLRIAAGTGPETTHEEFIAWRDKVVTERRITDTVFKLRDGRVHEIHHEPTPDGGWVATFDDVTARVRAEEALRLKTALLDATLENMDQGLVMVDAQGSVQVSNRRAGALLGQEDEVFLTPPMLDEGDVMDGASSAPPDAGERSLSFGPQPGVQVQERLRPDGTVLEVRTVQLPNGGAVRTYTDVTERRRTEETLRRSEERLALALDSGSDGLWDWNVTTGRAWFSDRWCGMLGYSPDEIEPRMRTWDVLLHPDDRGSATRLLADHFERRSESFECEHRLQNKEGGWNWILARGKVVSRDAVGKPLRVVGTMIDIGARKAAESQIAHMARHDGLTDLPARVLFYERLEQSLFELARDGGSCAVLCLDLDRFKAVNDTLGHLVGDVLLQEIARRLREVVPPEGVVARLGGDEFAVLVDDGQDRSAVGHLAERLVEAVGRPVQIGDQHVEVGLSVGIALAPEHGADSESVFRRADLALYRAKSEGRNTARFFETGFEEEADERRSLEADLRHAVTKNQLSLHYQPQVKARTGELVGFEALLRWQHPLHGTVAPAGFIPIAEDAGLMPILGDWVLRSACLEAAGWANPLKVAVNLSPKQFQPDLPERILAVLSETGLPPARLELEITETTLIGDMVRALGILRRIKAMGISIAMDDFGTGYSSLATLQAFPFDKLKIDRGFVAGIDDNPHTAVIVRAVIGLGRSLGMQVIAEGVETERQAQFLSDEACDELQGYLFGKPQDIAQFAGVVKSAGRTLSATSPCTPVSASGSGAGRRRLRS